MSAKHKFQSDALQYLYDTLVGDDPELVRDFEKNLVDIDVAQKLYDLRTKAGLSQRELAKRVGTTASVICRLESADYQGHSLAMLARIATALNKRVDVRFVAVRKAPAAVRPKSKRKAG